ncbi:MAG: DNA polymerase III subunit delta' [Sulfurovum sp.]|jgi:DNA polymerase-3 subunit delta'|uniref:DNA polymerase III subunit delta' n=1 Tax=Sulfurovum sp. TaxID=1969726 RepID=UPI003C718F85
MRLVSQVIITAQIENTILELEKLRIHESIIEIVSPSIAEKMSTGKENESSQYKVHRIPTEKEIFSVKDAQLVIEKAYLASEEQNIIILAATQFSIFVQNKLLKIIEEPPENKVFILISESKSAILPTIKSRLPVTILSEKVEEVDLGLDLKQLSLATVYDFVQTHKRTDAKAMKLLIERISKEAIHSQSYDLDEKTLTLFSNAFIALDVGSPPQFVLNTLLLKLLARKKR